jgi:hypothetical protein
VIGWKQNQCMLQVDEVQEGCMAEHGKDVCFNRGVEKGWYMARSVL